MLNCNRYIWWLNEWKTVIVTLLFLALGVVIGFGSSLLFLPRNTTSVSTTQG